jgi:hypothetical protein
MDRQITRRRNVTNRAERRCGARVGVRLIIQPGTADVRGGRVVKKLFLDGVLVEPGDGAQPPVTVARARPLASSSRAKVSMSARRTENSGRDRARHQPVNWRRSSVYASRVSGGGAWLRTDE